MSTKIVRTELNDLTKNADSGVLKVTDKGVTVVAGNRDAAAVVTKLLKSNNVEYGGAQLRRLNGKETWFIPVNFPKEFKAVSEFVIVEKAVRQAALSFTVADLLKVRTSKEFQAVFSSRTDDEGNTFLVINGVEYAQNEVTHEHTRNGNVSFTWSKYCEIERKAVADFASDGKISAEYLLGKRSAKPTGYSLPSATGQSQAEKDAMKKLAEKANPPAPKTVKQQNPRNQKPATKK